MHIWLALVERIGHVDKGLEGRHMEVCYDNKELLREVLIDLKKAS